MSAHRRPLITAAASGSVLLALWFVPSAKAAPEHTALPPAHSVSAPATAPAAGEPVGQVTPTAGTQLAGTDGPEFMPYVAGGLGLLGLSGALLLRSRRP